MEENNNEYNNEPVYFCKHCLSLKVKYIPVMQDFDYCEDCGSTSIEQTTIDKWEELYQSRYGIKYLNK